MNTNEYVREIYKNHLRIPSTLAEHTCYWFYYGGKYSPFNMINYRCSPVVYGEPSEYDFVAARTTPLPAKVIIVGNPSKGEY